MTFTIDDSFPTTDENDSVVLSSATIFSILFVISYDLFKSSPVDNSAITAYSLLSILGKNVVFIIGEINIIVKKNNTTTPIIILTLFFNALIINSSYFSFTLSKNPAFCSFCSIFSRFRNLLAAIGTNSIATIIDTLKENIIANDISLNTSFANPFFNIIGKNTHTEVNVDATNATITSFVPLIDATNGGSLFSSICLNILSSVTTELSTNDPTPRDNPISDIKFSDTFCEANKKNVNAIDIGTANATTNVALISFKNTINTITASINAWTPVEATLFIESFTFWLLSCIISYDEPCGKNDFISSNWSFALSAISTKFPSLVLLIAILTASFPFSFEKSSLSFVVYSTFDTSFNLNVWPLEFDNIIFSISSIVLISPSTLTKNSFPPSLIKPEGTTVFDAFIEVYISDAENPNDFNL